MLDFKDQSAVAQERCQDCFALIEKESRWYCDEGDCPIEDVTRCDEWTNPGVGYLFMEY